MASVDLDLVAALWAIASALGIGLIGAWSLLGGRSRPRGGLAFGLFSILWSVQILVANMLRVSESASVSRALALMLVTTLLPLPYFLVEFAASQRAPSRRSWRVLRAAAAATALLTALLLVVAPHLLFEGIHSEGEALYPLWGPLLVPLVSLPLFAAFGIALHALAAAHREAPTPRTALRAATLLAGLGIYVGFAAGNNLTYYLASLVDSTGAILALDAAYLLVFTGLALSCAHVAWQLHAARRDARSESDRQRASLLLLAIAVPFSYGAVEGLYAYHYAAPFDTVGLWRLLGVGVLAYGLAHWRMADLPARAGRAAATAGGTLVAGAAGAAVLGASTAFSLGPGPSGILAVGTVLASLVPGMRLVSRIFHPGDNAPRRQEETLYAQRMDAYRAALELSCSRGTLEDDEDFLAALRERFRIAPAEDRLLRYYAHTSVIVPRSQEVHDAYDRLRLLGEGGGGRTWLARERSRDRLVVLKEPLPHWQQEEGARAALLREARAAAKVRHPNVVTIYEVIDAKSPMLVMEYLEGGSLADVLRNRGRLPWHEAVPLAVQALNGVEAIHQAGLVHRDVKPGNVLLDAEGAAKVIDFGIAIAQPSLSGRTMILDASPKAGTQRYMAPEVLAGHTPGTPRSDVYACGVLLHELIHGAVPGDTPILAPAHVPPSVAKALARALSERPEDRHPSARAFAEELAQAARGAQATPARV